MKKRKCKKKRVNKRKTKIIMGGIFMDEQVTRQTIEEKKQNYEEYVKGMTPTHNLFISCPILKALQ